MGFKPIDLNIQVHLFLMYMTEFVRLSYCYSTKENRVTVDKQVTTTMQSTLIRPQDRMQIWEDDSEALLLRANIQKSSGDGSL